MSVDDEHKEWDFEHYNRVVNEMNPESTSVGSILASMVYQIEEQNKAHHVVKVKSVRDSQKSLKTVSSQSRSKADEDRDRLINKLDDMFSKVAFENAAI